jgi:hypothetical protein
MSSFVARIINFYCHTFVLLWIEYMRIKCFLNNGRFVVRFESPSFRFRCLWVRYMYVSCSIEAAVRFSLSQQIQGKLKAMGVPEQNGLYFTRGLSSKWSWLLKWQVNISSEVASSIPRLNRTLKTCWCCWTTETNRCHQIRPNMSHSERIHRKPRLWAFKLVTLNPASRTLMIEP